MRSQIQAVVSLTVNVKGSMRQICKILASRDLSHMRTAISPELWGQLIMCKAVWL